MELSSPQRELLALCQVPGLSWSRIARVASSPEGLQRLSATHLQREGASMPSRVSDELSSVPPGTWLMTASDPEFPQPLRYIPAPPPFLFGRGTRYRSGAPSIAIVGTRKSTAEGERVASEFATVFAQKGFIVVSGLAAGIDTAAHQATVSVGAPTIAVLGTGIAHSYPRANTDLAEEIVRRGGTLLSQFWPSASAAIANFPQRNAVTAALSGAVLVVQASGRSGALDCASRALKQGRPVLLLADLVREDPVAARLVAAGAQWVGKVEDALDALRDKQGSEHAEMQTSLPFEDWMPPAD